MSVKKMKIKNTFGVYHESDEYEQMSGDSMDEFIGIDDDLVDDPGFDLTFEGDRLALLQKVMDAREDHYIVADTDGNVLYRNNAVSSIRRFSEDEFAPGQHLRDVIGEDVYENVTRLILEEVSQGTPRSDRFWIDRVIDSNNTTAQCYIERKATPLEIDGQLCGVIFRIRDLTDALYQQDDIQESYKKLLELTGFSSHWLFELDSHYRFTWVNEWVHEKYGWREKDLIGKTFQDLAVNDGVDYDAQSLQLSLDSANEFHKYEFSIQTPNGQQWIEVAGVPVLNKHGSIEKFRGVAQTTTEYHNIVRRAEIADRRFLQAIDSFISSFALFDEDDRLIAYNKKYKELHPFLSDYLDDGLTFERCLRIQLELGLIDPEPNAEEWLAARIDKFRNPRGPFTVEKANNQWYRITEQRLEDGGCLKTMVDISELKGKERALEKSEKRFKRFAEVAADWFWELDQDLMVSYLSEGYEKETGQSGSQSIGLPFDQVFIEHISDTDQCEALISSLNSQAAFDQIDMAFAVDEFDVRYFSISGVPDFDENGAFQGYIGAARDITDARRLAQQLQYQASHDELTGLLNRREFERQLSMALSAVHNSSQTSLLAFFDLDQFKVVNDTKGHLAGDQMLKLVASLLESCVTQTHVLARLGGDEFGLLMTDCSVSEGIEHLNSMVRKLREFKFRVKQTQFDISTSVGVVELTRDCTGISEVMRRADIACYAAKDLGRNQVHQYKSNDEASVRRHEELLKAAGIREALDNNRFVLFVQPIATVVDDSYVTHHNEVLVRMLDDNDNLLLPGAFIPAAERYKLMGNLDRWIIRNAISNYVTAFGSRFDTRLTINLSGNSMTEQDLATYIHQQLVEFDVPPRAVCFEITETALVSNLAVAQALIHELKEIGCYFALDDFGSGMSSFSYLKHFSVDYLKIDGAFVRDIATDPTDRVMVSAINEMAHVMGIKTIAEFVENDEISKVLCELNVDYQQGYFIGRPRPMLEH